MSDVSSFACDPKEGRGSPYKSYIRKIALIMTGRGGGDSNLLGSETIDKHLIGSETDFQLKEHV